MRLSTMLFRQEATRTNGSILDCAGQLTPITPRSFAMNPLLWKAFLRIHDVIRDELGEYFSEVYLPSPSVVSREYFSHGSTPTEEEIAVKYIQETMPGAMDFSNSFFYFKEKTLDSAPSGVSIPSKVADQMVIYSFSPNSEDMYNQGKIIKEFFKKISSRIGLSIIFVSGIKFSKLSNEEIMSLYPDGDESLLYYPDEQCWTDENVLLLERELFSFNDADEIIKTGLNKRKKHKALQVGEFTYWGRVKTCFKEFGFNSTHSKYYVGKYVLDLTRAMDAILYQNTGEFGFVWPYDISPYKLHLICSNDRMEKAEDIYDKLREKGISVLYDDRRNISFDEKFKYAKSLGIPKIIVIGDNTGRTDGGVFLVNRETWEQEICNM